MHYDQVSKSYILLEKSGRKVRFWLDEEALDKGQVKSPTGVTEHCPKCGQDLADADVHTQRDVIKVTCCHCTEVYQVQEKR